MSKTITANIPATKTTQALVATFVADDEGRWTGEYGFGVIPMREDGVIDMCQRASNWQEIRAAHFPMCGFHA